MSFSFLFPASSLSCPDDGRRTLGRGRSSPPVWCIGAQYIEMPYQGGGGGEGEGKWVGEPINILLQALHLNNFSTGYQQSLAISLMTVTYIIKTGWWRRAEKFFLLVFRSVRDGLKKQTKME